MIRVEGRDRRGELHWSADDPACFPRRGSYIDGYDGTRFEVAHEAWLPAPQGWLVKLLLVRLVTP